MCNTYIFEYLSDKAFYVCLIVLEMWNVHDVCVCVRAFCFMLSNIFCDIFPNFENGNTKYLKVFDAENWPLLLNCVANMI